MTLPLEPELQPPLDTLMEEPVVSGAAPLGPAPEASADLRLSRAELVEVPAPVLLGTPVLEVVAPAVRATALPAPESEGKG
jgi:hypothetical protein